MVRVGTFEITKNKRSEKWAVNVSVKLSRTGKRYRKLFQRKVDAEKYRNGLLLNHSHPKYLIYDPDLLETVHYYQELFSIYGLTLAEVCSQFNSLLEKKSASPPLKSILKKYRTTHSENWSDGMLRMVRWAENNLLQLLTITL